MAQARRSFVRGGLLDTRIEPGFEGPGPMARLFGINSERLRRLNKGCLIASGGLHIGDQTVTFELVANRPERENQRRVHMRYASGTEVERVAPCERRRRSGRLHALQFEPAV